VLRVLLDSVVDYAGLFPPATLSMHDAVAEFAQQRRSPDAWMLGRFVLPVARLEELASESAAPLKADRAPWPLSALVSADPAGDLETLRAFNAARRGRLVVESLELGAATGEAVEWALSQLDPALECFVEIPLDPDPRPLVEVLQRHGGRAKARTGGVTAEAFPSAEVLARFIALCAELHVPFKATAGLHHPLRGEHRLTYDGDSAYGRMFGFLNVFGAAVLARGGADRDTLVAVLEERDPGAFAFDHHILRWRDHTLDVEQVAATRRDLALSFGSCSFREPVDDLHRLGLL
jgi:hypothetical protein